MSTNDISAQASATLAAVVDTIAAGHVLHVRADRLPARRSPKRAAMPAVDFTLGPDGRGAFLLVDYSQVKSGEEQRHESAEAAVRAARKLPGWDRLIAFRVALVAVHGEPERAASWAVEDMREAASGARLYAAFGHRRPVEASLFGGCGVALKKFIFRT